MENSNFLDATERESVIFKDGDDAEHFRNAQNEARKRNDLFDLVLVSKEGGEVHVHKVIMYAASGYFRDLLTSGMKESSAGRIQLSKIPTYILEKLVDFIYTGRVEVNRDDVLYIMIHAKMLQLPSLVTLASQWFCNDLNEKNCLQYWRYGKENLVHCLADKALAYILKNCSQLFLTPLFQKDLSLGEVITILKDDRLNSKEEEALQFSLKWSSNKSNNKREFLRTISKIIDYVRFPQLSSEAISSNILSDEALMKSYKILGKVAEGAKYKWVVGSTRLKFSEAMSPRLGCLEKQLVGLFGESKIAPLGDESQSMNFKRNDCGRYSYTTFGSNFLLISDSNGCEYFSPITNEWREFPSLNRCRTHHASLSIFNKIYVLGGIETGQNTEIFDLNKGYWFDGPNLIKDKCNFSVTTSNGALYAVAGGSSTIENFDPRSSEGWSVVFAGGPDYTYSKSVTVGDFIHCFSGSEQYIFDPRMNKCAEIIQRPLKLEANFGACVFGEEIYVFGKSGSNLATCYKITSEGLNEAYSWRLQLAHSQYGLVAMYVGKK